MPRASLETRFERVIGGGSVAALVEAFAHRPTVLVAGGPLTGKSAAARALADRLQGEAGGVGHVVRRMARDRGVSVEAMTDLLEDDDHVRIDHAVAVSIARGEFPVFEGRLVAHIGSWLRARGRRGLLIVGLTCGDEERVRRALTRDSGTDSREVCRLKGEYERYLRAGAGTEPAAGAS